MLRLLERWPTQPELAAASREELVEFARRRPARLARTGSPTSVAAALAAPSLPTRDYLVRAKAAGIRLAAVQLLALHEARRGWERRMAELLLGGPRTGRDHTVKDPDPGKAFPGGEIYLSMPGLGDLTRRPGRGEIGEHIDQFDSPNGLQCYAGTAPVTRRSGQKRLRRRPPPRAQPLPRRRGPPMGVLQPAHRSGWAREFYDEKIAAGKGAPRRPAGARQPLAGGPLALPAQGRPLRRDRPRRQPQPRARTRRLRGWLTEGVSSPQCVASWPELVRNSNHSGLRFMSMRNLMRPGSGS